MSDETTVVEVEMVEIAEVLRVLQDAKTSPKHREGYGVMIRSHRIRLNPTPEQELYFRQCADVARFSWNWALAEYNGALARQEKPSVMALSREFNRRRNEDGFAPWVRDLSLIHISEPTRPY